MITQPKTHCKARRSRHPLTRTSPRMTPAQRRVQRKATLVDLGATFLAAGNMAGVALIDRLGREGGLEDE